MSYFFIFMTQINLSEPCGWREFEMCLWSSVLMLPPVPKVGSLSITAVTQTLTAQGWAARSWMVAAFLPGSAPASPPPPSHDTA